VRAITYERPSLTDYQTSGFFHQFRIGLIEGATKTGKGHAGLTWLFEQAAVKPKALNYWWVAPVYQQAAIAYNRLKLAIPRALRKCNETDLSITLVNKRVIRFLSGEKPDNLYGEDVGAAVIDEATRLREASWHAVRSTLTYTRGPVRIMGNVKGKGNWMYKLARKAQGGEQDMHYAKFVSAQAVAAGILAHEEIEGARRDLPENVFKELYLAEASDESGNPFGMDNIAACVVSGLSVNPPVANGVDLAKSVDWTVIIGLDWLGTVSLFERFQKPWEETITAVDHFVHSNAMVDSTGVGDPILERLQRGGKTSVFEGLKFTSESKQKIMEGLAVAIQGQKVHYPDGPIRAELEMFEYEYTRTGVRYTAPEGMHDDCVCALAMAWSKFSATQGKRPASSWGGHASSPPKPSWMR